MKAATSIRELPNSLLPNYPLRQGEDDEFYVPLYEEEIEALQDSILNDNISAQTLFVAGQTGTGKTTALHFLPNDEIKEAYEVVYLNAKEAFDVTDVTAIEILIMICYKLMQYDSKLEQEFFDEVEKLDKVQQGILEHSKTRTSEFKTELGAGARLGLSGSPIGNFLKLFKLSTDFFASLILSADYRAVTREAFRINPQELVKITNRIVDRFIQIVAKEKKLLVIINELDHIRSPKLIEGIFIDDIELIKKVGCKKVISVPVTLLKESEFKNFTKHFCIKLNVNPLASGLSSMTKEQIAYNYDILRKIIRRRIDSSVTLIEDHMIDQAIEASGGIVRQYLSILHEAARHARRKKGAKINDLNLKEGKDVYRQMLERSIVLSSNKIDLLNEIRLDHQYERREEREKIVVQCLLGNQIIVYMNDPTWYSINPLIEETVRIYAEKRKTAS
ncbi:MAG: hypothetical protein AAGI49_06805 [Bacteroidota bacterium]